METTSCKTKHSQVEAIDCINWDEVDAILLEKDRDPIPKGGITTDMIMEKYECSSTTARSKINKLVDSGAYEKKFAKNGSAKVQYIIKKEV